jgi:hypothetical protein
VSLARGISTIAELTDRGDIRVGPGTESGLGIEALRLLNALLNHSIGDLPCDELPGFGEISEDGFDAGDGEDLGPTMIVTLCQQARVRRVGEVGWHHRRVDSQPIELDEMSGSGLFQQRVPDAQVLEAQVRPDRSTDGRDAGRRNPTNGSKKTGSSSTVSMAQSPGGEASELVWEQRLESARLGIYLGMQHGGFNPLRNGWFEPSCQHSARIASTLPGRTAWSGTVFESPGEVTSLLSLSDHRYH